MFMYLYSLGNSTTEQGLFLELFLALFLSGLGGLEYDVVTT